MLPVLLAALPRLALRTPGRLYAASVKQRPDSEAAPTSAVSFQQSPARVARARAAPHGAERAEQSQPSAVY